jgi:hypothetical protein
MPSATRLTVATIYVPAKEATRVLGIDPGSGIVGTTELHDGYLTLYYEGNRYNAVNMRRFEERIYHAAGRMFEGYPTIARMSLPVDVAATELVAVGEIDRHYKFKWNDKAMALKWGDA